MPGSRHFDKRARSVDASDPHRAAYAQVAFQVARDRPGHRVQHLLRNHPDKSGAAAVVGSGNAKLAAIKIDMKSFLSITTLPWVES